MSQLIIQFFVLTIVIVSIIAFILRRALISSTEGAVHRLNEEIKKANEKQMELNLKIKQADEELEKRRAEAKALAEKMRTDAEEESKSEREKMIAKARQEGEEIIAKAQMAKEKIRQEVEKEVDVKALGFSMRILNDILTSKAKGGLDETLLNEFLENLKNVDMSKISADIKTVDVVTLTPLDGAKKQLLASIIKEKLNRELTVNATTDPQIGGGVILKFGTMALDGSIQNLIRESAVNLQSEVAV